jgi:ribosome-binding ATPase YchF (GTP1/OBG family)
MKTNKAERDAIASKFIKRMKEKMILRNKDFKKSKEYKDISKNVDELAKLRDRESTLDFVVREQIAKYNKDNPSEYWKLSNDTGYRYSDNEKGLRLQVESEYSLRPLLCDAILIAQVGVETVDEMFEYLEKEVAI